MWYSKLFQSCIEVIKPFFWDVSSVMLFTFYSPNEAGLYVTALSRAGVR